MTDAIKLLQERRHVLETEGERVATQLANIQGGIAELDFLIERMQEAVARPLVEAQAEVKN